MDTIPPVTDSILVSASSDPNEIIGTRGYDNLGDTMQWVAATASLPYTIYFKNDAKLASRVTITVPLHEKLNYTTFWVGNCSHVL